MLKPVEDDIWQVGCQNESLEMTILGLSTERGLVRFLHFTGFSQITIELGVNTQVQTYAQIPIHAQIPAYVQLPALFQPHVPLQPSTHLHRSQAPISIAAKCLTQPQFLSLLCSAETLTISTSQVLFLRTVMRWPCLIFRPQVSWRPEVKHIGRIILHQQSPFSSYIFYSPVPVSAPLTLTIPVLLDPRSCDLSSSDYYSSVISLV